MDRAGRAGWRELDHAELTTDDEVGVEPPVEAAVEAFGTINVRDRDDDDLELQVCAHVELLSFENPDRGEARPCVMTTAEPRAPGNRNLVSALHPSAPPAQCTPPEALRRSPVS